MYLGAPSRSTQLIITKSIDKKSGEAVIQNPLQQDNIHFKLQPCPVAPTEKDSDDYQNSEMLVDDDSTLNVYPQSEAHRHGSHNDTHTYR